MLTRPRRVTEHCTRPGECSPHAPREEILTRSVWTTLLARRRPELDDGVAHRRDPPAVRTEGEMRRPSGWVGEAEHLEPADRVPHLVGSSRAGDTDEPRAVRAV